MFIKKREEEINIDRPWYTFGKIKYSELDKQRMKNAFYAGYLAGARYIHDAVVGDIKNV